MLTVVVLILRSSSEKLTDGGNDRTGCSQHAHEGSGDEGVEAHLRDDDDEL